MTIKLSIIVPTYNVAPYLRKCVDSLLAQDYADYEMILVDDGSTDGSSQICDQIVESQQSRVESGDRSSAIKVIHQTNAGLSAARNSGLAIARGDYVCFVDSDDYWQPNVLGALMSQIERGNLDVLRFKYQYVREDGTAYNPYKINPYRDDDYSEMVTSGISFLNERMGTNCYAVTFIVRRELLYDCRFTEGIYFEDTDWTPRMLVKAQRVASTDRVVYNYLLARQGSITNAPNRAKQQKVLDDLIHLIATIQQQAIVVGDSGGCTIWYRRMISVVYLGVLGMLSAGFYKERIHYLKLLDLMNIHPLYTTSVKARIANLSPRLIVEMLHIKNEIKLLKTIQR